MQASTAPQQIGDATPPEVHHKIGHLTRQLHDALRELGLAEKLQGTAEELPDVKSRLSYIARLTGEAAEKVLNRVDQAKSQHDKISAEARRMMALLVKDPVSAVAKGHIMNFLTEIDAANKSVDQHLTEIMMAQDFHDLTGQVISKVVNLATTIEEQLVELLLQTAPSGSALKAPASPEDQKLVLMGPVVDPANTSNVVTNQSEVDDLLASLGF
jgi:chemotaxis protein CheZ